MPTINGKKFSYTPKGKRAAKTYAKKVAAKTKVGTGSGVKAFFGKMGKK